MSQPILLVPCHEATTSYANDDPICRRRKKVKGANSTIGKLGPGIAGAGGCIGLREFEKSLQRTFLEIPDQILGKAHRSPESASAFSPTRRSEFSSCVRLVQHCSNRL